MRKCLVCLLAFGCAAVLSAAVPSISSVVLSDQGADGRVTVSYNLSVDAIVTCEMLVDGVPVSGKSLTTLVGDVNRRISAGNGRSIAWSPILDGVNVSGKVKAKLRAWPLDNPPDYMAVELTVKNCRTYYASSNEIPYGVDSDIYRYSRMLMRRIPAKDIVWRMGQPYPDGEPSNDRAANLNNETGHMVKLTNDYYMAVFQMTQRQYFRIMNSWPGINTGDDRPLTPVSQVAYDTLRGTVSSSFAGWPAAGHAVAPGSVFAVMRDLTGIDSLDLPTEAEWEYACRAGTGTQLNIGVDCKDTVSGHADANYAKVGWSKYNAPKREKHAPVGLKLPNAWGLYDMHGNANDFCLDWWCGGDDYRATFASGWETGAVTVAPTGPASGSNRVARGGDWFYGSSWARSASRQLSAVPTVTSYHYSFRPVCRIDTEAR